MSAAFCCADICNYSDAHEREDRLMTVGELIERLYCFDESLPVRVRDRDYNDPELRHANLPEHEQYVMLTTEGPP